MSISKFNNWTPATHSDPKPDPMLIPYKTTPQDRDTVAIARIEVERLKRQNDHLGLITGTATATEWNEAREAFKGHL